ncbi:MAG: DNA polymerase III subunit alpha, partial [Bacteroidales bacterium]|nr:DNA polymerase III subunit alpha [Bacteroidales bacterium]
EGYRNLSRLTSKGFLEGFYYTPRIDKEILRQHREGLIASSACIGGEVPSAILNKGEEAGEKVLQEYIDIFGDDFYLELQNHNLPEQHKVNPILVKLAKKYNRKVIATNDVHYINQEDFDAHRILICLNTGKDLDDESSMEYTGEEYLKTPEEMSALFPDYPEAITNTQEIVDKIEDFDIKSKIILPVFPLPEDFDEESDYLRHLTYEGAKGLYPEITNEIRERLDYELRVINDMGFPGYFLIVQDFIRKAKEMDVIVGPGRGSAAGSAVAYCTGITNIDPIKYNLLFERFLNPERVSMPDIDIDFDDEGREKVLDYVVEKYGKDRVAQIVTFGTMAARLAIRDVARVLKLPLSDADRIAKMVPERPGTTLKKAYKEVPELNELKKNGQPLESKTLQFAETLEGSARHTGTHACGVIIGPDDLIDHVPLSTAKDSKLMVTQYEGKLVESVGMLKMDFLGLKTLSIIKDAIENIRQSKGVEISPDEIPLDDEKTFELYQRGDTVGTFQFESDGMRLYLRELKPTSIEDLIAMNALYRPGPMAYIPMFINRKHGKEKVDYPHPKLVDILKPTYGIMVYQEQIMQTAQIIGGFSLGQADLLRRAMGKKKREIMEKQKVVFVEGAAKREIEKEKAEEIYGIMEKFAEYGFNRSHSAAYSVIAYHTAYLKANFPAEYMASVLTHNLNDIKKITFFIDESRRMGIPVLGPDVNESEMNFTVNDKGEIRFGMAAIKGVGSNAVKAIVDEREENGLYKDVLDFAKRINLKSVNRKCFEALAQAGAFDCFEGSHRAQYFYREASDDTIFIEKIIRHAATYQEKQNSSQVSLFGDDTDFEEPDIELPECEPWSKIQQLKNERDVTGFYISGHPLDDYRIEMDSFCSHKIGELTQDLRKLRNKVVSFAGMVTMAEHRTTKNNKPFGRFAIEDFNDSISLMLFGEDYLKLRHFLVEGSYLLVKARVAPRFNNEAQLEVRVSGMSLLAEAIDQMTHEVILRLNQESVTDEFISRISELIRANKGKKALRLKVYDKEENVTLELKSKKSRVNPSALVKDVSSMPELDFKLS